MKCPICKKPLDQNAPYYPFCGERCKIIDLGNWVSGRYVISTPKHPSEDREEEPET